MAEPKATGASAMLSDGRLVRDFIDDLAFRRKLSPNTIKSYEGDLREFHIFLTEECGKVLVECNRNDLNEYVSVMRIQGLSDRTINRRISSIRGLYRFIKDKGRISESPCTGLKSSQIPQKLPKVLRKEDVEKLLSTGRKGSITNRRAGVMLELMYATGVRISESVGIRLEHLRLESGIVFIEKGKGSRDRMVVIPPGTMERLVEYIENVRPVLLGGEISPYLFMSRSGGKLTRQSAWRDMKNLGRAAGLKENLHPHLLRHTCATHLLENGCDLRTVQILLGHRDIRTTEIYTHVLEEHKRKTFQKSHPRA